MTRRCARLIRPILVAPPGRPGERGRRSRAARVLTAAVVLSGCATFSDTARVPPSPIAAVPPPVDEWQEPTATPRLPVVVQKALRHIGAPYRYGGSTPAGFDCSGFVRYVHEIAGIGLPRTVAEQYRVGDPVGRASLRPGDLVFFDGLRHNGIYIGQGRFVHASSGSARVDVSHLDDPWFRERFTGARRLPAVVPARADVVPVRSVESALKLRRAQE